jgi:hypothetical protein
MSIATTKAYCYTHCVWVFVFVFLSWPTYSIRAQHSTKAYPQKELSGTPFEFKGDAIGETLDQFRAHNSHVALFKMFYADDSGATNFGPTLQVNLPICAGDKEETNPYLELPELERSNGEERLGIVVCVVTPHQQDKTGKQQWGYWQEFPTIADVRTLSSVYKFYLGELYSIEITFPFEDYETVKSALSDKYGPPPLIENPSYTNGLGVASKHEVLTWATKTSTLIASAVDGAMDISSVVFTDKVLAFAVRKAIDTPAKKDL